jgi:hypothetical protein
VCGATRRALIGRSEDVRVPKGSAVRQRAGGDRLPRMRCCLSLFIATTLVGCIAAPSPPEPESPASSSIAVLLPDEECRAGDTCSLDLGDVLRAGVTRELQLVNFGAGVAVLDSFALTGSDVFSLGETPTTVPGLSHASFTLTAAPTAAVPFHADLRIRGNEAPIVVELVAQRVAGGLELTGSCAFGDVPVGTTSATCDLAIINSGSDDGEVRSASLSGDVFSSTSNVGFPMTLAPGDSIAVAIVATPTALGLSSATFAVELDDGSRIEVVVVVNGI